VRHGADSGAGLVPDKLLLALALAGLKATVLVGPVADWRAAVMRWLTLVARLK
jgi:hypothetical protein